MEAADYGLTWDDVKNRKADVVVGDSDAPAKKAAK